MGRLPLLLSLACSTTFLPPAFCEDQPRTSTDTVVTAFGHNGKFKMLYDVRQRPHTSSWTYRISDDNGKTWHGPQDDVTDLDSNGRLDWSSYQTKLPSRDGKYLHVVYTDYDDNKRTPDPRRFFNPRYDRLASNEWKYNLSYLVVGEGDLEGGYMDRHGGGRIEEWVSKDKGKRWKKRRDASPTSQQYAGWRFNNVQPVVRPDGSTIDGMLLFYGWKDENAPEAMAFLLHEASR